MSVVIPGRVIVGRISSSQKDFPALGFWLDEAVGNVSVRVVRDDYGNTTRFSVITSVSDSAGGRAVAVGVYDAAPRGTIGLALSDDSGDVGTFDLEGFEVSSPNSFSNVQQTCFFVGKDGDVVETSFCTMSGSDFDGVPAAVRAWDYYDASTTVGGVSLETAGAVGRITIPSNPTALTRIICLAVSDKNGNDAIREPVSLGRNEIVVVQAGADSAGGATVTASPAVVDFSAEGGVREILVESENAGTLAARTAESWISASVTGTSGRIEVAQNTSSSARSGTATFYGSLGGSATVTVNQEGEGMTLSVEPDSLAFGYAGGSQSVAYRAGGGSTVGVVFIGAGWVSVAPLADPVEGSAVVTAEPNPDTNARSCVVRFSNGAVTADVTISQNGKPEPLVSVSPSRASFTPAGGTVKIAVRASNAGTVSVQASASWFTASADGTIIAKENTSSSARSGTATFYGSLGGSATVAVAQEAKFDGSIPEGNMPPDSSGNVGGGGGSGGGGGLVGDGEFSFFDDGKMLAERGRDLVFENEASVEGGVAEDGGESWSVKFTMRRARVSAFVRQARLFLHSAWQPVKLPSRNKPSICGWDVRYTRGGLAAVTIKYKVSAGVAYRWKSENSAPDTRSERIATGVAERPISECDALWPGESSLQRRAEIVNILKKILAYDAVAGDEVIARLNEAAKEYLGGGSGGDDDAQSRAALAAASDDDDDEEGYGSIKQLKARFPEVVQELSNGTDSFLAYTAEAVLVETSDTRMTTDVPGVYDDPSFQQIRLPSAEAWLLVSDEIECDTGGIYKRTRRWQAAERRSACYGG